MEFNVDTSHDTGNQTMQAFDVANPRIDISFTDHPGKNIEVKLSDDGAIIVDVWDDGAGEFVQSHVLDFSDLLEDEA